MKNSPSNSNHVKLKASSDDPFTPSINSVFSEAGTISEEEDVCSSDNFMAKLNRMTSERVLLS